MCQAGLRTFSVWIHHNSPIRELILLTPIIKCDTEAKGYTALQMIMSHCSALFTAPRCPFPAWLYFIALEFLEGRYCVSFVPVPSSCTMHDTGWALNEWVSESMNALMFKIKGNYFLTVCPFDFYCLIPLWWSGSSGMIVWTRCVIGISFRAEGGWAQPIKSEGLSCF